MTHYSLYKNKQTKQKHCHLTDGWTLRLPRGCQEEIADVSNAIYDETFPNDR